MSIAPGGRADRGCARRLGADVALLAALLGAVACQRPDIARIELERDECVLRVEHTVTCVVYERGAVVVRNTGVGIAGRDGRAFVRIVQTP